MARPSKDGSKRSFYLDKELEKEFEVFCEKTGRTKTKVVELALREYMDKHKSEME